jgi:hypothetical protein
LQATISNDGAKILQLLDIVHPAAKTLVDIARAQDAEIGDGTTTVTLLAAEFLRLAKPFVEDGVHPQIIIRVRFARVTNPAFMLPLESFTTVSRAGLPACCNARSRALESNRSCF